MLKPVFERDDLPSEPFVEIDDGCDTCVILIKMHGIENLKMCSMCGHLYFGDDCICGRNQDGTEQE